MRQLRLDFSSTSSPAVSPIAIPQPPPRETIWVQETPEPQTPRTAASFDIKMKSAECPLCFRPFPLGEIEAHAANCGILPKSPEAASGSSSLLALKKRKAPVQTKLAGPGALNLSHELEQSRLRDLLSTANKPRQGMLKFRSTTAQSHTAISGDRDLNAFQVLGKVPPPRRSEQTLGASLKNQGSSKTIGVDPFRGYPMTNMDAGSSSRQKVQRRRRNDLPSTRMDFRQHQPIIPKHADMPERILESQEPIDSTISSSSSSEESVVDCCSSSSSDVQVIATPPAKSLKARSTRQPSLDIYEPGQPLFDSDEELSPLKDFVNICNHEAEGMMSGYLKQFQPTGAAPGPSSVSVDSRKKTHSRKESSSSSKKRHSQYRHWKAKNKKR